MSDDLKRLLGCGPMSPNVSSYLGSLALMASITDATTPEVKSYSDAVYFNYYALGLSLLFKPIDGYNPKTGLALDGLDYPRLLLDGIDIYNVLRPEERVTTEASDATKGTVQKSSPTYKPYPVYPITINLVQTTADLDGKTRPTQMTVMPETSGKEFVSTMGEPDRKGGGAGPSSGSINIWCEWSKDGVMVEFAGSESRGPQAWERGRDAVWKVISIFPPK